MQPFLFWPTNRMWKARWRRQRSLSASHSTPSHHTRGMFRPAAPWQEKGESTYHTSHSLLLSVWLNRKMTVSDCAVITSFSSSLPVYLPVWTGCSHGLLQTETLSNFLKLSRPQKALQRPQCQDCLQCFGAKSCEHGVCDRARLATPVWPSCVRPQGGWATQKHGWLIIWQSFSLLWLPGCTQLDSVLCAFLTHVYCSMEVVHHVYVRQPTWPVMSHSTLVSVGFFPFTGVSRHNI